MNPANMGPTSNRLPVRAGLMPATISSTAVALLMIVAAAAGLIWRAEIYPTEELLLSFAPSDAFILIVGLPILLGSMWLANRGSLIGLLCWPGALLCTAYIYFPYLLSVPFNVLFLAYLLLVVLSVYTLIDLVAVIDDEAVKRRLIGFVPARTAGGILAGLAILVIGRQTAMMVAALGDPGAAVAHELPTWIADFALAPALLGAGVSLWRRQSLGYVAGAGLLLGYALLALGLVSFFVFQARLTVLPFDIAGLIIVLAMAAICLVPFAFFMRGARVDPGSPPA
jgi:hypothetical protein